MEDDVLIEAQLTDMDHPTLTLRRAIATDASALAAFADRTFEETFGPDNRPEDMAVHLASSYGSSQQARELSDPDYVTSFTLT